MDLWGCDQCVDQLPDLSGAFARSPFPDSMVLLLLLLFMRQFGGSRDRAPLAAGRHGTYQSRFTTPPSVCLSPTDSELLVKGLSGETAEMSRDT